MKNRNRISHKVGLPGVGKLSALMKRSAPVGQGAFGALLGVGGALGGRWIWNKTGAGAMPWMPGWAANFVSLAGSAVVGSLLYFGQKKSNPTRATAHLVGALAGGAAVTVWDFVRAKVPALAEMTVYDLSRYGLVVDDSGNLRQLSDYGVVVDAPNAGMQQAAAVARAMNGFADDTFNPAYIS